MWPGRGESRGQPPDNDDNDNDGDDNDDNDNEMMMMIIMIMIFGGLSLQILEVLIHGGETVLTCPDHIIIFAG